MPSGPEQCWRRNYVFGLFIGRVRSFVSLFGQILLPRYLINGFGNLDENYRECSLASEDVVLRSVDSKCMPILLYATEVCPLSQSDIRSLDFAKDIINDCCTFFSFKLLSKRSRSKVKVTAGVYTKASTSTLVEVHL